MTKKKPQGPKPEPEAPKPEPPIAERIVSRNMRELSEAINRILGTGSIDFTGPNEDDLAMVLEVLTAWREEMNVEPRDLIMGKMGDRVKSFIDSRSEALKKRIDQRLTNVAQERAREPGVLEMAIDAVLGEEPKTEEKKKKETP